MGNHWQESLEIIRFRNDETLTEDGASDPDRDDRSRLRSVAHGTAALASTPGVNFQEGWSMFSPICLLHLVTGWHVSSCATHSNSAQLFRHRVLCHVIPDVVQRSLLGPPSSSLSLQLHVYHLGGTPPFLPS